MLCLVMLFSPLSNFSLQAGEIGVVNLPKPGTMIALTPAYDPSYLTGLVIRRNDPLKFDFLVHRGEGGLDTEQKKQEYNKLIKYFLASLTIPDQDQWVNLSPYEKDRIINNDFGKTEMGRDLLAQDYILKQMSSSLMYPESGLGKDFWSKVYAQVRKQLGKTDIPVNTFNKVWIVPSDVLVYENSSGSAKASQVTAYIVKSHLKVMLEEDYVSLKEHTALTAVHGDTHTAASAVIKEIILPVLEKEVNEGRNFAQLRQVVSGMVLAAWYKKSLKESLLAKAYVDRAKVKGVDLASIKKGLTVEPKMIYEQYLAAFKKGVYNYIKDDEDHMTHQIIPRKYFSGGFFNNIASHAMTVSDVGDMAMTEVTKGGGNDQVVTDFEPTLQMWAQDPVTKVGTDQQASNQAGTLTLPKGSYVGQDGIVAPVALDPQKEFVLPSYLASYDSLESNFFRIAIKGEPSDVVRLVYSRPEGLILFTMNKKKERSFEYLNNTELRMVGFKDGIVAKQNVRVKGNLISKDGIVFTISKIDIRGGKNNKGGLGVYYKVSAADPNQELLIYNDDQTPKKISEQDIQAWEKEFKEQAERKDTRDKLKDMLGRGESLFGGLSSEKSVSPAADSRVYIIEDARGRRYMGSLEQRINFAPIDFKDHFYAINVKAVYGKDLGYPTVIQGLINKGILKVSETNPDFVELNKPSNIARYFYPDEIPQIKFLLDDLLRSWVTGKGKYIRAVKITDTENKAIMQDDTLADAKTIGAGVLNVPNVADAFGINKTDNTLYVLAGNHIYQVYRNNPADKHGNPKFDTVIFQEVFPDGSVSNEPIYVPVNGRMTESGLQCFFQENGDVYITFRDQPVQHLRLNHENAAADSAMAKGGIDLNAANVDIKIRRDGNGMVLPFSLTDIAAFSRIEGLVPIILEIKPFTAMPVAPAQ